MTSSATVLIVGGGVIGGSIAWELSQAGFRCTVLDKGSFSAEASTASAGMLCPQAEMLDAVDTYELFAKSMEIHRSWVERLEACSHVPVQYVRKGMLRLAASAEAEQSMKDAITRMYALQGSGGATSETAAKATNESELARVRWLTADEVHELEPDTTPDIRGGMLLPRDGQLHPIHLARSLYAGLARVGCSVLENTPVASLIVDGDRVVGVRTPTENLYADYTIVAAGAWSSSLLAPLELSLPVFPVKGQMVAVRANNLSIERTIQGPKGMILPRQDGSYTVGVTHLDTGFDKRPTVDGISEIYQNVVQFIPKLREASFLKTWAGLRPGTPDGLPYIGPVSGVDGLLVATGHYTVGIFLAPITAILTRQLLTGQAPEINLTPFSPERFAQQRRTTVQ